MVGTLNIINLQIKNMYIKIYLVGKMEFIIEDYTLGGASRLKYCII